MLISDKYGFVIAMPTKTGTNTMRAVVEKWQRRGGSPSVIKLLTGERATRHRIAPPPGREDYQRYMMVREPRARLVSMYEYLRRKDWEWSAKEILNREAHYGREEGWLQMLRIIAAIRGTDGYFDGGRRGAHGKRPYMWTDRQSEMWGYMMGIDIDGAYLPWAGNARTDLIRLESLESDWHELLADHEVDEDDLYSLPITQRNATPDEDKLFGSVAAYLAVDGASDLIREVLGPERIRLGYSS